jgi:large subunit ribosomal protein L24
MAITDVLSVFATRICTSKPHFDKNARRYKWARFAANLSVGETSVEPNVRNGRIQIPWPAAEARKDTNPTAVDTLEKDATSPTLEVCEPTSIPPSLVPQSLRAPPPTNQAYSDKYVFSPEARASATLQAAMPLYLGEELSPRFSRAKLTKGWTARREMEAAARDHHAAAAVAEWEAGGRDAGLEDLLALPAVNLEGVTIRSRTRREVRDAAGVQFDKELAQNRSQVKANAASGARFNHVTGVTHQGAKGIRAIRKRIRKARKQEKITHRLQRLTLSGAKNQVIPADVHAN